MNVILKPEEGMFLRDIFIKNNIYINSPCGGNGKCGKCRVKLIKGETYPSADENGYVNACKTRLLSECVFDISYDKHEKVYTEVFQCGEKPCFAICDVGTTNIKIDLYSKNLKLCSKKIMNNPQIPFGADVISRISACKNQGYKFLSKTLREEIFKAVGDVEIAYVCGNPTMIHFMAEVDPSPIGVFPFECVFKDTLYLKKRDNDIPFDMVLLPSASGYVGSDAICGIYKALEFNKKVLLIADIGTNGEISLIKDGEIYTATTAAGPAIEGMGIEMGLCGGDGVIYGFSDNGDIKFKGKEPKGINGGGFISLISFLLQKGIITENGHLPEEKYYISEKIYISQKDISGFMVAKSAVKTAIELLLKETETEYEHIEGLILTGGVCTELKIRDVSNVGLIPKELEEKTVYIPSLASSGLFKAFCNKEIDSLEVLSQNINVLNLSANPDFEERFVLNTFFVE